eukprot:TRINITY_DN75036_c0_g1_i1.p1 TRINITY_DN75036_c0_g1~~TRINITY_DN75036_c0_g1_i1.p1  ORF type:complete len:526 (+),score=55.28 TRINITY_DN75036_c0_g1_i1:77-1579(+)
MAGSSQLFKHRLVANRLTPLGSAVVGEDDGGEWSAENSVCVGKEGEESRFLGKARLIDRAVASGIRAAISGLNRGMIHCPEGFCVVFSSTYRSYYALYRCGRRDFALAALGLAVEAQPMKMPASPSRCTSTGSAGLTIAPSTSFGVQRAPTVPEVLTSGRRTHVLGYHGCDQTPTVISTSCMMSSPLAVKESSKAFTSGTNGAGRSFETVSVTMPARLADRSAVVISSCRGPQTLVGVAKASSARAAITPTPKSAVRSLPKATRGGCQPLGGSATVPFSAMSATATPASSARTGRDCLSGVSTGLSTLVPTVASPRSCESRDSLNSSKATLSPPYSYSGDLSPLSRTLLPGWDNHKLLGVDADSCGAVADGGSSKPTMWVPLPLPAESAVPCTMQAQDCRTPAHTMTPKCSGRSATNPQRLISPVLAAAPFVASARGRESMTLGLAEALPRSATTVSRRRASDPPFVPKGYAVTLTSDGSCEAAAPAAQGQEADEKSTRP